MLCAPLVAGCGATRRVDFGGHSRPPAPIEVSVISSRRPRLHLDPRRFRPGAVVFDITNQTSDEQRYSLRRDGRLLSQTPPVAPGQAAQLKATVDRPGTTLTSHPTSRSGGGRSASIELDVSGSPRTGDNAVAQP